MSSRIDKLAEEIQAGTKMVSEYLTAHKLPFPSFAEDGPVDLQIESPEVVYAKMKAIGACFELLDLLQGPRAVVKPPQGNLVSLQAIYHYGILHKVPLGGEISFQDLATKCNLYEPDLRRIVRFAITYHRLFREQRAGFVSHSATSKWLSENPEARDGVSWIAEAIHRSSAATIDAMDKFHDQEPNHTGFNLAYNTDHSLFEYFQSHPDLSKTFAGAMKTFTANVPGHSPSLLATGYPWESLGGATVVDCGGSSGHVSIALAEAHPQLKFIVQDIPVVIQKASAPESLKDRMSFEEHSFFEPQKTQADVYFFRWVFHDWPDKYAVKILQQLIPALKSGCRVIINDSMFPGPDTVPYEVERTIRGVDMTLLSLTNTRERELSEWEPIFKAADARFGAPKFYIPPGASLAIIESVWEG